MLLEQQSLLLQYVHGELSQRMQQPGNTWLEAWQLAEPLPVQRQKKLFDHTTEAEKVTFTTATDYCHGYTHRYCTIWNQ